MVTLPQPKPYYRDAHFPAAAQAANRRMGFREVPPTYKAGKNAGIFEEHFRERIVPEQEWKALYDELKPNQERLSSYVYDQNGFGTCTSFAMSAAIMYQWNRRVGQEWSITPSGPSMYPFCASGGNSGSTTNCIYKRAVEHGVLLIDNAQNRKVLRKLGLDENHVIDEVQWNAGKTCPQSWYEETAKHFKCVESYEVTSARGWFSAILLGFSILYGRSGHAIAGVGIEPDGNSWTGIYQNSWGQWGRTISGKQCFGEDSMSYIQRTGAYRGAFAVRAISEPPGMSNLLRAA